jgi:hypothetical protein
MAKDFTGFALQQEIQLDVVRKRSRRLNRRRPVEKTACLKTSRVLSCGQCLSSYVAASVVGRQLPKRTAVDAVHDVVSRTSVVNLSAPAAATKRLKSLPKRTRMASSWSM